MRIISRERMTAAGCLAIITPLGFASKFYDGPLSDWVNDSLSGVFYVIFWCLAVFLIVPRRPPRSIAVLVLAVTCILEFLQLSRFAVLERIRASFIGRALIGTTFVWSDFIYYIIGASIGGLIMMRISARRLDSMPDDDESLRETIVQKPPTSLRKSGM